LPAKAFGQGFIRPEDDHMRLHSCAFCQQPLDVLAWKGSDQRFYCNEFCASDADDAALALTSAAAATLVPDVTPEARI
jgi:hypothetical protein